MIVLCILFGLGLALRLWLLYCGYRLRQFTSAQLRQDPPDSAMAVTLIAPCKGIDPGLEQNVRAVLAQEYPGFWQVIFVVESQEDPAYSFLKKILTLDHSPARTSLVVAGLTENCSQKIHNMLAAMSAAHERSKIFAFVDSDVRPAPHWLAYLTAPLKIEKYPASTGYRWYVPVRGGWASATRAVWNALVSAVGDPRWRAYAWGGSFAVRRNDLQEMKIDRLWAKALSEDLTLSTALHKARKKVAFVTQCIVPSHEDCNWSEGFDFIRRQSLVARIYARQMWYGGWLLCLLYLLPLLTTAAATAWLLACGRPAGYLTLAATLLLYGLGSLIGLYRRKTVRPILPRCNFARTRWMDVLGQPWVVAVTLAALIYSALSRKMLWRGRLYTLLSPQKTLVRQGE